MSADRWSACPRCAFYRAEKITVGQERLDGAYGTVPLAEFDEMREALEALIAEKPPLSLREDYEFYGAEEGELSIGYRRHCATCDLTFKYETTVPLPVLPIVAPR